jgi:hypothetical protein
MAVSNAGTIQSFESLVLEYSKLTVASFQRNYAWEISNIEDLYSDLKEKTSSFIGCFIFQNMKVEADQLKVAEVVDGQQRLTTLFLFLAALRDAVMLLPEDHRVIPGNAVAFSVDPASKILEILFNGAPNLPRFDANPLISKLFLKNMLADPVNRPKVPVRASDGMASRSLRSAYYAIDELIKEDLLKFESDAEKLEWINQMRLNISGLKCLRISSDAPQDALEVFLSLNSKGKPLSRADIIRGILLQTQCGVIDSERKIREIHEKMHGEWTELVNDFQAANLDEGNIEQFFRYYLLATESEKVQKKAAPKAVENRVDFASHKDKELKKERTAVQKAHAATAIWEDIISYYPSYIAILKPSTKNFRTNYYLTMLRALSDNYRILLMVLMYLEENEDSQDVEEIARLCFALSLRHYLNGGNAQDLESAFQKIANELQQSKNLAEVISTLYTEIKRVKINVRERFSKEVLALAKPTLHFIEWNLCDKQGISPANLPVWSSDDVHLEHIAPETPTSEWRLALSESPLSDEEYEELIQQIGNKTLLDARINKSIKQSDFKKKKTHYADIKKTVFSYAKSSFFSTRELEKLPVWTSEQIKMRNEWLALVFDALVAAKVDKENLIWFEDWRKNKN